MQLRRVALVRESDRANPEHVGGTWKQRTERSMGQCCPGKGSAVAAAWSRAHSTPQTALHPNCPSRYGLLNTHPAPKNDSSPNNRFMNHSISSIPLFLFWRPNTHYGQEAQQQPILCTAGSILLSGPRQKFAKTSFLSQFCLRWVRKHVECMFENVKHSTSAKNGARNK